MPDNSLLARREAAFGPGAPLFYDEPLHIVRGEDVWLVDADGRRYLDLYNNVPCVGHCHPHVVDAIHRQAGTLNVHSRYLSEPVVAFVERLTGLHATHVNSAVLACTGTEANEIAMQMARLVTGGRGFICTNATYHGNSALVGQFSRAGAGPAATGAEVRSVPFPEQYRPIADGLDEAQLCARYLEEVDGAIAAFAADGVPLAGMMVCSICANEGLPDIPAGYMAGAAQRVRAAGGLFIADEVQAGYCRTGQWWGYQASAFEPDIVTMGKPMGNGVPLSACAARREHVETFRKGTGYFNTFASSPLQAAAGNAVIDVIEHESLAQRASDAGEHLRAGLRRLQQSCEFMGDVRGHGNFSGVEWITDPASRAADRPGARQVVNAMKERGFLFGNAGAFGNIIKLRPPLTFTRDHADQFLDAFGETLRTLHA